MTSVTRIPDLGLSTLGLILVNQSAIPAPHRPNNDDRGGEWWPNPDDLHARSRARAVEGTKGKRPGVLPCPIDAHLVEQRDSPRANDRRELSVYLHLHNNNNNNIFPGYNPLPPPRPPTALWTPHLTIVFRPDMRSASGRFPQDSQRRFTPRSHPGSHPWPPSTLSHTRSRVPSVAGC